MKRAGKLAVLAIAVVIISILALFEVYGAWDSREMIFEKEPHFIIRNIVHVLNTKDYIAVTYKKDAFLVKERFRQNGKPILILTAEKSKSGETYIEFFRGFRESMLWLRDSESDPPIVLLAIHCGRVVVGLNLCDSFKER